MSTTRDSSDFEPSTIPDPSRREESLDEDPVRGHAGEWTSHALDRETQPTAAPGSDGDPSGQRGVESRRQATTPDAPDGSPATHESPKDTTGEAEESLTPSTQSLSASALQLVPQVASDLTDPGSPPARLQSERAAKTLVSSSSPGGRFANTTMQSVARPGPPPSQSWDERRIIHLERETDQLVALTKLLGKREKALARQLRWQTAALSALAIISLLVWLL